ncbi:MAG: peptidoglycan-binding domain-containing protein [Planctomycetota bacterium]
MPKPPLGPAWALSPTVWQARVNYDLWRDVWTPKDKIIVHYGGGANSAGEPDATLATIEYRVRAYEAYHIDGRGWRGLAYQWWFGQDGTCGRARGWNISGAQYSTDDMDEDGWPENEEAVAVLWVGGGNQQPTPAAIATFERLRAYLEETMGQPMKLYGHQEVDPIAHPTACPGPNWMSYIEAHRLPGQPPTVVATPIRWPRVLKSGDKARAVLALRGHLLALGYGGKPSLTTAVFDLPLADRVERFQAEHGLVEDGKVGPATRAALAEALTDALGGTP